MATEHLVQQVGARVETKRPVLQKKKQVAPKHPLRQVAEMRAPRRVRVQKGRLYVQEGRSLHVQMETERRPEQLGKHTQTISIGGHRHVRLHSTSHGRGQTRSLHMGNGRRYADTTA